MEFEPWNYVTWKAFLTLSHWVAVGVLGTLLTVVLAICIDRLRNRVRVIEEKLGIRTKEEKEIADA